MAKQPSRTIGLLGILVVLAYAFGVYVSLLYLYHYGISAVIRSSSTVKAPAEDIVNVLLLQNSHEIHRYNEVRIIEGTEKQSSRLKIPTPIFILNLPKTATMSIHRYFSCGLGKQKSVHYGGPARVGLIGKCMYKNVIKGQPLVKECGNFDVYSDAGAVWQEKNKTNCFYPGIHGLDNIAQFYPNATIMHLIRDKHEWIASARPWKQVLPQTAAYCDGIFPQLTPQEQEQIRRQVETNPQGLNLTTNEMWMDFYERYTESIRAFAHRPGTHFTFVETSLESPTLANFLENVTGISASCWGHHHRSIDSPWVQKQLEKNSTAYQHLVS